jgi:hypothetical protein
VSRVTGLRPVDINTKNAADVWERVYGRFIHQHPQKEPKFRIGETVRISLAKKIFDKGFFPNFSDHIFTIYEVHKGNPNYYHIKDNDGEKIEGKFYEEELQAVTVGEETTYRIEKVIKKKVTKGITTYLVKYIGYDKLEWINAKDIVN